VFKVSGMVQQELIHDTVPQVRLDEREKDEALITYFIAVV
jgi:hypothetical protein